MAKWTSRQVDKLGSRAGLFAPYDIDRAALCLGSKFRQAKQLSSEKLMPQALPYTRPSPRRTRRVCQTSKHHLGGLYGLREVRAREPPTFSVITDKTRCRRPVGARARVVLPFRCERAFCVWGTVTFPDGENAPRALGLLRHYAFSAFGYPRSTRARGGLANQWHP